jgi:hypothetical protein
MPRYDDLLARKGSGTAFDRLEPASPGVLASLDEYGAAQTDYRDFLRDIGWGELGSANFMLYGGLLDRSDVYGDEALDGEVFLFGDDFSGYCVGFRRADWRVVELDPRGNPTVIADDFETFIRKLIARLEEA